MSLSQEEISSIIEENKSLKKQLKATNYRLEILKENIANLKDKQAQSLTEKNPEFVRVVLKLYVVTIFISTLTLLVADQPLEYQGANYWLALLMVLGNFLLSSFASLIYYVLNMLIVAFLPKKIRFIFGLALISLIYFGVMQLVGYWHIN